MANVFKFGNRCQLALNLDNVGAVDVSEVENKWCVRFFFTGGKDAYNLATDNKEIADGLFEEIVKAMDGKGDSLQEDLRNAKAEITELRDELKELCANLLKLKETDELISRLDEIQEKVKQLV